MLANKLSALIIFFLLAAQVARSQAPACTLSLRGHINTSDNSDIPANVISIYLPQIQRGVLANDNGGFVIHGLCPGKQEVQIKYLGYQPVDTIISINTNQVVSFLLHSEAKKLDNLVVTGREIHQDQLATAPVASLSGKALEATRGLSLGESLKSLAGVNSIQTGPSISKPVIHGVYSNRILILNNGVRQEGQNWGNDHAPEIDPFIATKLTVIKGAASIRYGSDAMGGVVLVEPKDLPTEPGVDGNIDLVGMSNGYMGAMSGMMEGTAGQALKGLSWRLQGTLKKAGAAKAPHYYMKNTGFEENDYSATLKYDRTNAGATVYYSRFNTRIGIAAASHIGTLQDLYDAFRRSVPATTGGFSYAIDRPYQTVDHQLVKATGFIRSAHWGKIEGQVARQKDIRKEYDADISWNDSIARLNPPDLYFQLITHTADLVWDHPVIKERMTGSIGFNFITQGNVQEGTGYQELIPNFRNYGGGAFIIEKLAIRSLTLEGGFRYDYRWLRAYTVNPATLTVQRPTYNWQNTTVTAGASYDFSKKLVATCNFGTAWRPPQVIELYANGIHQSAASFEHGDTSLTLEKAYNSNIALQYNTKNFEASAGIYVNYFHHYIYLKPDSLPVQTIQGAFPSFHYIQVNALFEGLDLSLTYHFLQHFSWLSKIAVVRARDLDTHNWLINIPADHFDNTITYEWPAWGNMKNCFISIHNLIVSKQSRVPPKSDYVDPPAGYMLWGADIGCSVPLFRQQVNISLSVTNLTNKTYRDYLNRFRYFLDDEGRNVSLRLSVPILFNTKSKDNGK